MISSTLKTVFLSVTLSLVALSNVFAQGVIQRSQTPYVDRPEIQFSIGAPPATSAQPVAPAVQPAAAQLQRWEVLPEDRKLSRALLRWATQERLQFFYEAPKDPVAVRATYFGSFDQAVPELMDDTQVSGYPLRACRYNNALRVRHASQSCPLKQTTNEK